MNKIIATLALATGISCTSSILQAKQQTRQTFWELGVGAAAFDIPLYPGSKQDDQILIPFPLLRIQTDYFEIDEGIRGFFYESPDIRLNISGDLGIPVNSSDSDIRDGMPDINTVVQIGPSLEVIFDGGRRQPFEFRLELPVRAAIASDLKNTESVGWIIEPRITYETLRPYKTGFSYQVSTGIRYATKDYHEYYYNVPAAYATAERPAFESESGYSGYFLDLAANWRTENIIYFAFARYQNLTNAEYEESPLVEQTDYLAVGVGIVWIFAAGQ